jgi:hypothetical protein
MMLRVLGMLLVLVLVMPLGCAQKPIKVGVPLHAAPSFTIGPRTSIISAATLAGLGNWFWQDSGIGILNNGDGTYAFFASIGGSGETGAPGKVVGTMSNPLSVSSLKTTISGALNAPDDNAPFVYQGGGPVYKDPASGMLLLFSHQERQFNPSFGGTQFYAWLGILKSTDGGNSWIDCGAIITPYHTFAEMAALYGSFGKSDGSLYTADIGWGPYLIVGDYFYVYYWNADGPITSTGVFAGGAGVARGLVAEVVAAAAAGTVSVWHKYNAGAWTELGIRGKGTTVYNAHHFAVSYNTYRNRYVMFDTFGAITDKLGIQYRESVDGITWSHPPQLFEVAGTPHLPLHIYPTLVDPSSPDPYLTGQAFYLIAKNWDTGEVDRFLVTLTGDPISPSSSPGGSP